MIDNMNILQKAYNAIKEKIEFAFFKRKFDSWYEETDIKFTESIYDNKERIVYWLEKKCFHDAFNNYKILQKDLNEKEQLENFKKYVLNDENDEH